MFHQTDKSWCDYRALNQNWSYQPTLAGRAIGSVQEFSLFCISTMKRKESDFKSIFYRLLNRDAVASDAIASDAVLAPCEVKSSKYYISSIKFKLVINIFIIWCPCYSVDNVMSSHV